MFCEEWAEFSPLTGPPQLCQQWGGDFSVPVLERDLKAGPRKFSPFSSLHSFYLGGICGSFVVLFLVSPTIF